MYISELALFWLQLEDVKIEGLPSLEYLRFTMVKSVEQFSIGNLPSLSHFILNPRKPIKDFDFQTKCFKNLRNIEHLSMLCDLSDFNLDILTSLKSLRIYGVNLNDFKFDLLKNISNQLAELWIESNHFDDEKMEKLFYPELTNLARLTISRCSITKLEKRLFFSDRLEYLRIDSNTMLRNIDIDTFSSLVNLKCLQLQKTFFRA